eukprot:s2368_g3.t1
MERSWGNCPVAIFSMVGALFLSGSSDPKHSVRALEPQRRQLDMRRGVHHNGPAEYLTERGHSCASAIPGGRLNEIVELFDISNPVPAQHQDLK